MAENEKQVQPESAQAEETQEEKNILDRIIEDGRMTRDESQREWAKDVIGEFVSQIMEGTMVVSKDTEAMINARISQIDKLISMQLNEVMHNPELQKLEASWRGLHYLVHQSETGERLKIRVMNVSKKDLLKDMEKASEFDQSSLFKKIYEEEFGMFGRAPVVFGKCIRQTCSKCVCCIAPEILAVVCTIHILFVVKRFNWNIGLTVRKTHKDMGKGQRHIPGIFRVTE
jgi:type VI secretion system protein ImpC